MQSIELNLVPHGIPPVVYLSQYDEKREFKANIFDDTGTYTIPSDAVVSITGVKPDKRYFQYESDLNRDVVTFSGSTVTISCTKQMTAVSGHVTAELQIVRGGGIIGTLNFTIAIEKAAIPQDAEILPSEMALLKQAMDDVKTTKNEITKSENAAKLSEQNAGKSAQNAAASEKKSATSEKNASQSAQNAAGSERNAATSARMASENAGAAISAKNDAQTAEKSAKDYAANAAESSDSAKEAQNAAEAAAQTASGYAGESEYRIGIDPTTGFPAVYHYKA